MQWIVTIGVALVLLLVVVQIAIRRHVTFMSRLAPSDVLRSAAGAVGGGESYIDAAGHLSIPLAGDGILSVAAQPTESGTLVEVWLIRYRFLHATGFDALVHRRRVKRIRRSCEA